MPLEMTRMLGRCVTSHDRSITMPPMRMHRHDGPDCRQVSEMLRMREGEQGMRTDQSKSYVLNDDEVSAILGCLNDFMVKLDSKESPTELDKHNHERLHLIYKKVEKRFFEDE